MPLGLVSPFRPTGTAALTAGSTATNAALQGAGDTVVVTNTGNALAYVRFGSDSTVAATAGDMPVLGNSRVILSVNTLITYASALMPSGSGVILFSRGDGSII